MMSMLYFISPIGGLTLFARDGALRAIAFNEEFRGSGCDADGLASGETGSTLLSTACPARGVYKELQMPQRRQHLRDAVRLVTILVDLALNLGCQCVVPSRCVLEQVFHGA